VSGVAQSGFSIRQPAPEECGLAWKGVLLGFCGLFAMVVHVV